MSRFWFPDRRGQAAAGLSVLFLPLAVIFIIFLSEVFLFRHAVNLARERVRAAAAEAAARSALPDPAAVGGVSFDEARAFLVLQSELFHLFDSASSSFSFFPSAPSVVFLRSYPRPGESLPASLPSGQLAVAPGIWAEVRVPVRVGRLFGMDLGADVVVRGYSYAPGYQEVENRFTIGESQ